MGRTLDYQKCGAEHGEATGAEPRRSDAWRRRCVISSGCRSTTRCAAPKMEDRRRQSAIRSTAPKKGSAGADSRRPEVLRRRWKTGADDLRSEARHRRWRTARCQHSTITSTASKMGNKRPPTFRIQKHGAEDGGPAGADDPTVRSTAQETGNQQALTTDDQKHGAEDGDLQMLSLDDQKCGAEDGGPTGADPGR